MHRLKLERSSCALCVGRLQQRLYCARRTTAHAALQGVPVAYWSEALWKFFILLTSPIHFQPPLFAVPLLASILLNHTMLQATDAVCFASASFLWRLLLNLLLIDLLLHACSLD
jgi:hypothetical protein